MFNMYLYLIKNYKTLNWSGDAAVITSMVTAIPIDLVGYYTKDMIVGLGTHFFETAIYTNMQNFNMFDAKFISTFYKTLLI